MLRILKGVSASEAFIPIFAIISQAETFSLLPQPDQVHLGFQGHQEGAAVGNVQVKPQTCGTRLYLECWSGTKGGREERARFWDDD